jgi:hypothetical protein
LSPLINLDFLTEPSFVTDLLPKGETYYWRVRFVRLESGIGGEWSDTWSFVIPSNVSDESAIPLPIDFSLSSNYPNPFSATTHIRYALPAAAETRLEIFDTLGRRVHVLVDASQPAGWHETSLDATGLSSGVYFYRLTAGTFMDTKTLIVAK